MTGCLDSILTQTSPVDEIVLVDDRGGDDSMDIAVEHLRDARVAPRIVVQDRNSGPGRARNSSLAAASGNLIWFLDSDDEADPASSPR